METRIDDNCILNFKLETLKLNQNGNDKGKRVKREMETRIDDNCIVQNLIGNSKMHFT
jgi:hypothetical protein